MNACQQQDLLLDYVYEELSPAQAAALTEHLQGCAQCSRELMGMKGVRGAMAALPPAEMPEDAIARMTAEVMAAATVEASRFAAAAERPLGADVVGGGAGADGQGGKLLPLRRRGVMRVLLHPASGVLAAAALALVVIMGNGFQKSMRPATLPPSPVIREDDAPTAALAPSKLEAQKPGEGAAPKRPDPLLVTQEPPEGSAAAPRAEEASPGRYREAELGKDVGVGRSGGQAGKADVANLDALRARPVAMDSLRKKSASAALDDSLLARPDAPASKPSPAKPAPEEWAPKKDAKPAPSRDEAERASAPPAVAQHEDKRATKAEVQAARSVPAPKVAVVSGGVKGGLSAADDVEVRKAQEVMKEAGSVQRQRDLDQVIARRPVAEPQQPVRASASQERYADAQAVAVPTTPPAAAPPPPPAQAPQAGAAVAESAQELVRAAPRSYGNLNRGPSAPVPAQGYLAAQSRGQQSLATQQGLGQQNYGVQNQAGDGPGLSRPALLANLREQARQGRCKDAAQVATQIERSYGALTDEERQLVQACASPDNNRMAAEPMEQRENLNYQNSQNSNDYSRGKRAAPRKAARSKAAADKAY